MRCVQAGIYFSRQAIYDAGKKYGFLTNTENEKELDFDEEKFNAWVKIVTDEVPEGFRTMNECAKVLNLSVVSIWKYCRDNPEIETKKVGSKKGVTYVNINQLRKVIQLRKFGIKG